MFTALILAAILAMAGIALVTKIVRSAVAAVRGQGSRKEDAPGPQETTERSKAKQKPEGKDESVKEEASEALREEPAETTVEEEIPQAHRASLDQMARRGIVETYWNEPTSIEFNGKAFADLAVSRSALSYLEFNNRHLAGKDFKGFNIDIKDGESMALSHHGQVLVTLTRVDSGKSDGKGPDEARNGGVSFRSDIFPPLLSDGLALSELVELMAVYKTLKECKGDPCGIADIMLERFASEGNVIRLKTDIDRKIQKKESARLMEVHKEPKLLKK